MNLMMCEKWSLASFRLPHFACLISNWCHLRSFPHRPYCRETDPLTVRSSPSGNRFELISTTRKLSCEKMKHNGPSHGQSLYTMHSWHTPPKKIQTSLGLTNYHAVDFQQFDDTKEHRLIFVNTSKSSLIPEWIHRGMHISCLVPYFISPSGTNWTCISWLGLSF